MLGVVHDDTDLLVVNKPAGLVCRPTKGGEMSSLTGRVRLHFGHAEGRLINRLDCETNGLGGFSIETMEPLEPGAELRIRFVSHDDWSTVLAAKISNCRPSCADDGSPLYVAGFAFSGVEKPETKRTVQILIEKVTSVRLYGTDS